MHVVGETNYTVLELVSVHVRTEQIQLLSSTPCVVTPCPSLASRQADLKNELGDAGYVVFGVVLFVWELLPTTLVVYFFRVRTPAKDLVSKLSYICGKYHLLLIMKHASGFCS